MFMNHALALLCEDLTVENEFSQEAVLAPNASLCLNAMKTTIVASNGFSTY